MNEPKSRFHWPRDGVAVRVPPRRLSGSAATCDLIPFSGRIAQTPRPHAWDRLADALPRGARVVLLVSAEDVSFTTADVPALSGMRLREALPNLVEDRTVADVGTLHVALGQRVAGRKTRTLAVVDRTWLAAMQVHVVRAGCRVEAIVPESLTVPLVADAWSFASVGGGEARRTWLRTGAQEAMSLPHDETSATAIAKALARNVPPSRLDVYTAADQGVALAASLGTESVVHRDDPFAAWLAGGGAIGGYGAPLSLLAFDGSGSAWSRSSRWRTAAALAVAIVAVQIVGMQWQWAGLRGEANRLREQSAALLTTTFPDTKVVVDAPLQMSRGLAALRASAGRSDPADFSAMIGATARIFAPLPSNAVRAAEYEGRALRLRFAPGNVVAADERERFVAAAAQEGYVLRFEAATNAAGEMQASLRTKAGSAGASS